MWVIVSVCNIFCLIMIFFAFAPNEARASRRRSRRASSARRGGADAPSPAKWMSALDEEPEVAAEFFWKCKLGKREKRQFRLFSICMKNKNQAEHFVVLLHHFTVITKHLGTCCAAELTIPTCSYWMTSAQTRTVHSRIILNRSVYFWVQ